MKPLLGRANPLVPWLRQMSSTTSSSSGFLSSPRSQQRLLWISAVVLVIGVAVFLGVLLSRGGNSQAVDVSTVSTPPTDTAQQMQKTVPASPAALSIGRKFLLTAVLRKNLSSIYPFVGPDIKGGLTLAKWDKGNIAVQPYPAKNAKTTKFVVKESTKDHLMVQVALVAPLKQHVRPLTFWLGLDRIGGKWLVNYWAPIFQPPVLANPGN